MRPGRPERPDTRLYTTGGLGHDEPVTTPGVPMRKPGPDPEPDLERARAQVLAIVNGSAMARRAPTVEGGAPLRAVRPELRSVLAARPAGAGARPVGARPGGAARPGAGPPAALAALDLVGVVVGAATGHVLLAVGAAVLFVLLAGIALAARRAGAGTGAGTARGTGGSRPGAAERRELAQASRWTSSRPWTGPPADGPERGAVLAAADAAARISRSPGWHAALISGGPVPDVAAELDRIDGQAHDVAALRQAGTVPAGEVARQWADVLTRAATLTAYAEALDGLDRERRATLVGQDEALRRANLLGAAPGAAPGDERVDEALTTLMLWYSLNGGGG